MVAIRNCKIFHIIAVAVCLVGFVGCGEKTPQELRADFEEQIESNLSLAATLMDKNRLITREVVKCASKKMSAMFSDEEIRLVMDTSITSAIGEAMNNPQKVLAVQHKMESPEITNAIFLQCIAEKK